MFSTLLTHIFIIPPLINARGLKLETTDSEGKKHDLTPYTRILFRSSRKFLESGYTQGGPTTLYTYKLSEMSPDEARRINETFTLSVPGAQLQGATQIIVHLITDEGTISTSAAYPPKD